MLLETVPDMQRRARLYRRAATWSDKALDTWAGTYPMLPEDRGDALREWLSAEADILEARALVRQAEQRERSKALAEELDKRAALHAKPEACVWGHCGHVVCDPDAQPGGVDY